MSYRKLLLLLVVLLTLATGVPASLQPSALPRLSTVAAGSAPLQIEDEEYAVYSVLINQALKDGADAEKRVDASDRVLIINDSPSLWDGSIADESNNFFEELKRSAPQLQPETVNDLQVKSNGASRLEPKLSLKIKYLLVRDEEIDALFKDNVMGGWEAFHRKYPKSNGILTLSRVGFNADKTQALVYKGWSCGGLCGGGGYTLLAKKKGVWVVGPDIGPTWVS
jgi:hypothetical protein